MKIPSRGMRALADSHLPVARLLAFTACAALGAAGAWAQEPPAQEAPDHELEAYISSDALQALYARGVDVAELNESQLSAGFFLNESRDLIGLGSLLTSVGRAPQQSRWQLQVGPRVYAALLDNDRDVFGVGLGGKLSYFLTSDRATAASLSVWYAPDIVVFGEADDVTDLSLELQTALTDTVNVFVGFRKFELDLDVEHEVDDGMHVGFRGSF